MRVEKPKGGFMRFLLRRTFPMLVLTGLLLAGWGLLTGPSHELAADSDASLWGAKYAASPSSTDSWN